MEMSGEWPLLWGNKWKNRSIIDLDTFSSVSIYRITFFSFPIIKQDYIRGPKHSKMILILQIKWVIYSHLLDTIVFSL